MTEFQQMLEDMHVKHRLSFERIAVALNVSISTVWCWRRGLDPRYSQWQTVKKLHQKLEVGNDSGMISVDNHNASA